MIQFNSIEEHCQIQFVNYSKRACYYKIIKEWNTIIHYLISFRLTTIEQPEQLWIQGNTNFSLKLICLV